MPRVLRISLCLPMAFCRGSSGCRQVPSWGCCLSHRHRVRGDSAFGQDRALRSATCQELGLPCHTGLGLWLARGTSASLKPPHTSWGKGYMLERQLATAWSKRAAGPVCDADRVHHPESLKIRHLEHSPETKIPEHAGHRTYAGTQHRSFNLRLLKFLFLNS